jgi:octaprenyl-diphosphate synthase
MRNVFKDKLTSRPNLSEVYKDIQQDLQKVEENLKLFTKSSNRLISEINAYIFKKTGKRIRPALLLLCSKMFNYSGTDHIQMGSLVEALHTASLIHDDIIDNSNLRRGEQTVHLKWGPNITVLLGDFLYIKTLKTALGAGHQGVIDILSQTSFEMVEGELYEYYMSGNLDISEGEYFSIIQKKTASLFSASCQIGALLGRAKDKEVRALAEFGNNFGMTFQIVDDLLDYMGTEKNLGKPTLSDISEGRITLPLIYALKNGGARSRKKIAILLENKNTRREAKEEILSLIDSNGALDYTFQKAEEYSCRSKELLSELPGSTYREALSLLSDYILLRNR